jgi:hypothetical protein
MPKIENRPPLAEKLKIPSDSGIVLAAMLILLGIIAALVLQAQFLARSCLNLENNRLARAQLRETAGDCAWRALNVLANDPYLLFDSTNEEWAVPGHMRLPNGIETETVVIDENRFIDANLLAYVPPAELQRPVATVFRDLLASGLVPDPGRQTEIIRDWVDQDSEGAFETPHYRRLSAEIEAPNALIESREEFLWLLNATTNSPPGLAGIAVLPGQTPRIEPVNINTATRPTLLAVFGAHNAALVDRLIRLRDTVPLLTLDQVIEPATLQRLAPYLSVKSSFFSVHAVATMGSLEEDVYCLVNRDSGGNIKVLRWIQR